MALWAQLANLAGSTQVCGFDDGTRYFRVVLTDSDRGRELGEQLQRAWDKAGGVERSGEAWSVGPAWADAQLVALGARARDVVEVGP